jgi:hypothetical protein
MTKTALETFAIFPFSNVLALGLGGSSVGTIAMLVRTVIDYSISWDFYFS